MSARDDGRSPAEAPRLLFLSPVVPAPLDRGQNVRIHQLVLGLARHFRVTLVVPDGPGLSVESPLWTAVDRLVVARATRPCTTRDLVRFGARHRTVARPGQVARLAPFDEVLGRLPLEEFAALWVERAGLTPVVRRLGSRVVVDLDDVEHRMWVRQLRLHGPRAGLAGGVLRAVFNLGQSFVREVVLVRKLGACTVASPADATYLRRWGVRNVAHLPNGGLAAADTDRPPRQRQQGSPLRAVFVGNLGYPPNLDALTHFEDDVRPELDRLGLSVELAVVGPGATAALVARFPRADFRGFVPDLAEELRSADVSVVPVRLGGGTKLKVLDALAAGLPVVTTTVGAEGLQLEDGVHVLVGDSPQELATALARLDTDPALASSLAVNGRRLAEQRYSWQAVQDGAVEVVRGLLS